jgi:hypothetical protein
MLPSPYLDYSRHGRQESTESARHMESQLPPEEMGTIRVVLKNTVDKIVTNRYLLPHGAYSRDT